MSPIADIQARFRELGRIRLGAREPTGKTTAGGKPGLRPVKLETFRLTSQIRPLIEQAAELYGGAAQPWDNDGRPEWEVVTETDTLPVIIATTDQWFEQWYELWKGGGLVRRCDGNDQAAAAGPCECPADPEQRQALATKGEACKPTTRASFLIPDLADLGTWRLETHGYYATVELGGAKTLVDLAGQHGNFIPADLRLILREGARRPGQPRKTFYVPAISFRHNLGPILQSVGALDGPAAPGGVLSSTARGLPAPEDPTPVSQKSVISQLYDDTDHRVRQLDDSDYSRLVSWCADQRPPIPLDGVVIDGERKQHTIPGLTQSDVTGIAQWLDALDALASEPAAEGA